MPGCRYVQEYLAIGEAPDQIRNCYQQRSRWCKVGTYLPLLCSGLHLPNAALQGSALPTTWLACCQSDKQRASCPPHLVVACAAVLVQGHFFAVSAASSALHVPLSTTKL